MAALTSASEVEIYQQMIQQLQKYDAMGRVPMGAQGELRRRLLAMGFSREQTEGLPQAPGRAVLVATLRARVEEWQRKTAPPAKLELDPQSLFEQFRARADLQERLTTGFSLYDQLVLLQTPAAVALLEESLGLPVSGRYSEMIDNYRRLKYNPFCVSYQDPNQCLRAAAQRQDATVMADALAKLDRLTVSSLFAALAEVGHRPALVQLLKGPLLAKLASVEANAEPVELASRQMAFSRATQLMLLKTEEELAPETVLDLLRLHLELLAAYEREAKLPFRSQVRQLDLARAAIKGHKIDALIEILDLRDRHDRVRSTVEDLEALFVHAAGCDQVQALTLLIGRGVTEYVPALAEASRTGAMEALVLLMANYREFNREFFNANMLLAAQHGHPDAVFFWLERGAGNLEEALERAIQHDRWAVVDRLLSSGQVRVSDSCMLLMLAARSAAVSCVLGLLQLYGNSCGERLLVPAVRSDNYELVLLVASSAEDQLRRPEYFEGLLIALKNNNQAIAELMREHLGEIRPEELLEVLKATVIGDDPELIKGLDKVPLEPEEWQELARVAFQVRSFNALLAMPAQYLPDELSEQLLEQLLQAGDVANFSRLLQRDSVEFGLRQVLKVLELSVDKPDLLETVLLGVPGAAVKIGEYLLKNDPRGLYDDAVWGVLLEREDLDPSLQAALLDLLFRYQYLEEFGFLLAKSLEVDTLAAEFMFRSAAENRPAWIRWISNHYPELEVQEIFELTKGSYGGEAREALEEHMRRQGKLKARTPTPILEEDDWETGAMESELAAAMAGDAQEGWDDWDQDQQQVDLRQAMAQGGSDEGWEEEEEWSPTPVPATSAPSGLGKSPAVARTPAPVNLPGPTGTPVEEALKALRAADLEGVLSWSARITDDGQYNGFVQQLLQHWQEPLPELVRRQGSARFDRDTYQLLQKEARPEIWVQLLELLPAQYLFLTAIYAGMPISRLEEIRPRLSSAELSQAVAVGMQIAEGQIKMFSNFAGPGSEEVLQRQDVLSYLKSLPQNP